MDPDVIIVGAGAAGLAAALRLADRSLRVIVLEARDRVGGRVLSQPVGSIEVPADLGAEFIHGEAAETSAFLREAGLGTVGTSDESWMCGSDGQLRVDEDDFVSGELFERASSLDGDEDVETFLQRFEDDPHARAAAQRARSFVEGFEAADPRLASVRAIADEIRSGVNSITTRPTGGYAPLIAHLAMRCVQAKVDLRLGTCVEHIAWQPGAVTIEARQANYVASTLRARCAIVTVPVGVLQQRTPAASVAFTPALPEEKQSALRGLEMGHVVRVVLAFRTPFWEHLHDGRFRDAAFFRCERGAFNAFWTQIPQRSRSVVAWAGGARAKSLEGMTARARIDLALEAFGAMFGERDLARAEYEGGATHDWAADPFACGAYSYVKAGGAEARAALGAAVGETLFFAGEATPTDGQGGTVSGAFQSGLRAADEAARACHLAGATFTC